MKLNIQKFGGRGVSALGHKTLKGVLRKGKQVKSEQLDVSTLNGFPIALKDEFEKYIDLKNEKVEFAYLVDKNNRVIAAAKGTEDAVSVAYVDSKENMIMIHNHPGKYGGSFSGEDISYFTENKLKSIRAVAKEGTYSIVANKNADYMGLNRALAKDINNLNRQAFKNEAKKMFKGNVQRRKAYVDTIHSWYVKNASKYGFTYKFKANADYKL